MNSEFVLDNFLSAAVNAQSTSAFKHPDASSEHGATWSKTAGYLYVALGRTALRRSISTEFYSIVASTAVTTLSSMLPGSGVAARVAKDIVGDLAGSLTSSSITGSAAVKIPPCTQHATGYVMPSSKAFYDGGRGMNINFTAALSAFRTASGYTIYAVARGGPTNLVKAHDSYGDQDMPYVATIGVAFAVSSAGGRGVVSGARYVSEAAGRYVTIPQRGWFW